MRDSVGSMKLRARIRGRLSWLSVIVLTASMGASVCQAREWTVNKDGSGDFTRIVDAMDAIDHGDSVLIYPGRFAGGTIIDLPGQSGKASAFVQKNNITIRGTDRETVIIGPTEQNFAGFWPKGIVTKPGTTGLVLENLTIENLRDGCYLVGTAAVWNVLFQGNEYGIVAFTAGGLSVAETTFRSNLEGIDLFSPSQSALVSDCNFLGNTVGLRSSGVTATVQQNSFVGGGVGLTAEFQAQVEIDDSHFSDQFTFGVSANLGSHVNVHRSTIVGGQSNLKVDAASTLSGERTALLASTYASIFSTGAATSNIMLHGCDIMPASGYAVLIADVTNPEITYDFRDNYWGTESASVIDSLIIDASDFPSRGITILYQPFSLYSVDTKRKSISSLKALFGGEK
jgi:hypothetical protein